MTVDKIKMRRTWLSVLAEWGDAVYARWGTAGALIFEDDKLPSLDEASKAAKAAVAESALNACDGHKGKAAQLLGVTRPTFNAALNNFRVGDPPGLWDNQEVGTFDDSLFPFIRTRWDANPTEEFVENYRDWVLGTLLPRAAQENTKFVTLDDCSAWSGVPPLSVLGKMSSVLGPSKDLIKMHLAGIVIFLPNLAWTTWWNPLISLTKANIKFASAPDQAIVFATEYFQTAGVTPPPDLAI